VVVAPHDTPTPRAAEAAALAPVETSRPAAELPMADQIVQALRVQWRDGRGEATVTLHPQFLGNVSISLRVEDGGMSAVVRADESQVREWIQSNIGLLRDRLQDQGLTLQKFEVSDGYQTPYEQPRDNRGNSRPSTRQSRRQSRTTDTDEVFEVTA
jgi:flagellar hook-length control protein FliK